MLRPRLAVFCPLPIVFLTLACESPSTLPTADVPALMSHNAAGHRASGGGTVDVPDGRSTYAFHASTDGAGSVKGSFELHFTSVDANVGGDVTCMAVAGNQAWFGGMVTRTSDPALVPVGRQFVWRAEDNGEGANASPDRVSSFFTGVWTANRCVEKPLFVLREWTNGNFQLR